MSEQEEKESFSKEEIEKIRRAVRKLLLTLAALAVGTAWIAWLARIANGHEWAVSWFQRFEKHGPWAFCWRIGLEAAAASLIVGVLTFAGIFAFRSAKKESSEKLSGIDSLEKTLVRSIVRALLFRAAPVALLSSLGAGLGTQAVVSAYWSVFLAIIKDEWRYIPSRFASGLYFGFAFAFWYQTSFWLAAAVTIGSQALIPFGVHLVKPILRIAKHIVKKWAWILAAAGIAAVGVLEGSDSFAWTFEWLQERYKARDPWAFCWRITLEGMLASFALLIAAGVAERALKADWKRDKAKGKITRADVLIRAPIFETLFFQAVPIGALSWMDASFGTQAIVSAFLFAAAHFENSTISGIAAGIPGGYYLAFSYAFWLPESFWTAFWVTALSHALHNLPPAMLISGGKTAQSAKT